MYEGTEKNTKEAQKLAQAGEPGEIARLKREVKLREQDIETLKKQAAGLHREYDSLCEKYGAEKDNGRVPKKDLWEGTSANGDASDAITTGSIKNGNLTRRRM